MAHTGIGSITHLSGELLYDKTGIEVTTIAYPGSTPAHADVLSGRVSAMFDSSMLPHIEAPAVAGIGVTSSARSDLLQNADRRAGRALRLQRRGLLRLVAPRETPPEVVKKIAVDLHSVLQLLEVRSRMRDMTFIAGNTTQPPSAYSCRRRPHGGVAW